MQIKKILAHNEDFKLFLDLPYSLYDEKYLKYQSGINREFASSFFIAFQNDKQAGRVALYNNPYLIYNGLKSACIGNYECINDDEISHQLLTAAIHEAKEAGNEYIIGPMNGSTWDDYRFSLDHDHPNFFLEPYHHLYYNEQFIAAGFVPISHYVSYIDRNLKYKGANIEKRKAELNKNVKLRNVNTENFEAELEKIYAFSSKAFSNNFLYTSIQWETFKAKYSQIKPSIDPDLFIMAEDKDENVVGFIFCIEDILNTSEKTLIVKSLAGSPGRQFAGLSNIMGKIIVERASRKGYKNLVHAFMIESGISGNISKHFSAEPFKRYALYGLKL